MERIEKKSVFETKVGVILFSLFCMFLWGSAIPATKLSYEVLDLASSEVFTKMYFAGWRFFLASLMVLAYLLFRKKQQPALAIGKIEKKSWPFLIVMGLLRISLCYFFYYIALGNISGVKGSVLVSSSTFIIVFIAPFFNKSDRFTLAKLIALVLGFAGIMIANWTKGFDLDFSMRGEGFMLLSGVFTAIVEVLIKPKAKGIPAPIITWGQLIFGSIPLMLIGFFGLEHRLNWTGLAITLVLYGAFISAVAFILWYELLKRNDAGELAAYRLFIPIFGSILSAALLADEGFTIYLFLGIVFVVAGIAVLNILGNKKDKKLLTKEKHS